MARVPMDVLDEDDIARLNGQPFTGTAFELADGARRASELEYRDGLQHGFARDWYPDGRIHGETEYAEGVRHGLEREWFENGALAMEAMWEYDILITKCIWDPAGMVIERYSIDEGSWQFQLLTALRRAHGVRS